MTGGVELRILFVAMANSVHTARWVSQLRDTGWDIHVFDATKNGLIPELTGVTAHTFYRPSRSSRNVKDVEFISSLPFVSGFLQHRFPGIARLLWPSRIDSLTDLIHHLKPDIVHSLEMQHESYPLFEVRRRLGGEFSMPWIYSSWGSDLYLFGNQPQHQELVREVLAACDYYIADCQRDVALAREYGFRGEVLGVVPAVGGFDIHAMQHLAQAGPVSARRVVALKGYTGWAGRAKVALEALQQCADALRGYRVVVFLADAEVARAARYVSDVTGIPFEILPHVPHREIVELMGRSRLAIGVSISDGTPISMLEAMVMGAFPVQSDTVSTAEWIEQGKNGLLVPPENAGEIAAAVRRALADDMLVDRAAEINARLTAERIDSAVVRPKVLAMYEKVAGRASEKKPSEVLSQVPNKPSSVERH
jgi:glycosyltransferase involved in cell wall biosynthesis